MAFPAHLYISFVSTDLSPFAGRGARTQKAGDSYVTPDSSPAPGGPAVPVGRPGSGLCPLQGDPGRAVPTGSGHPVVCTQTARGDAGLGRAPSPLLPTPCPGPWVRTRRPGWALPSPPPSSGPGQEEAGSVGRASPSLSRDQRTGREAWSCRVLNCRPCSLPMASSRRRRKEAGDSNKSAGGTDGRSLHPLLCQDVDPLGGAGCAGRGAPTWWKDVSCLLKWRLIPASLSRSEPQP